MGTVEHADASGRRRSRTGRSRDRQPLARERAAVAACGFYAAGAQVAVMVDVAVIHIARSGSSLPALRGACQKVLRAQPR
jgi:hypothetical protein